MSSFPFLAALFLLGTAVGQQDFDETFHGYEFIYHDRNDLLLIIHGNHCYFSLIIDQNEGWLNSYGPFFNPRGAAEAYVIATIESGTSVIVRDSTLAEVRDTFQDILADYHCRDKAISIFDWSTWNPYADAWSGWAHFQ